jgi:hypothetical protein
VGTTPALGSSAPKNTGSRQQSRATARTAPALDRLPQQTRNDRLRDKLDALVAWKSDYAKRDVNQARIDVLITTNEMNDRHGTGVLVKRILKSHRDLFCIRFQNDWGDHDLGDWNIRLPKTGGNRVECFRNILRLLRGRKVRQVLCVPFQVDELTASIAIHEAFGARLCAYVMDDQNVAADGIPDELMREFLQNSWLRLATHPELRSAYERKYGMPFSILPALAPDALIPGSVLPPVVDRARGRGRGALLGSFWDQTWFDRLCVSLVSGSREIDWFGNDQSPFVEFSSQSLTRARIRPFGIVSEERLAMELRGYPFVIVPTGTFDPAEKNHAVASLSLPGRIPLAAAISQTPLLVIGGKDTCAARFVKHFGIGETVPYDGAEIQAAMDRLSDGRTQLEMRGKAARMGRAFSDVGIGEWLEESITLGRAADGRFEEIFAGYAVDGQ